MDTLTSGTESRAHQLASLETEFGRVSAALEDVRSSIERRLQELEKAQGAALSEEDVARLFGEEMSKHVEDRDSVLWVWLSGVSMYNMYVHVHVQYDTIYMYHNMHVCTCK